MDWLVRKSRFIAQVPWHPTLPQYSQYPWKHWYFFTQLQYFFKS